MHVATYYRPSPTPRRNPAKMSLALPPTTLAAYTRTPAALAMLKVKKTESDIWAAAVPFRRKTKDTDYDAETMYKYITWNVAGLRGKLKKDPSFISKFVEDEGPDILCLQETKLNPDAMAENETLGMVPGYTFTDSISHAKKGYSGTRVYVRVGGGGAAAGVGSHSTTTGFSFPSAAAPERGGAESPYPADEEGRVQTVWMSATSPGVKKGVGKKRSRSPSLTSTPPLEGRLALVNTYIPNSGLRLDRLPYRVEYYDGVVRAYLKEVQERCLGTATSINNRNTNSNSSDGYAHPTGLIWTGDLNVAVKDIDRYYAKPYGSMQMISGFTPEERASFEETLKALDLVDAFRALYPNAGPIYTYWSDRIKGRECNLGWRLDYFVISRCLLPFVVDVFPMPHILGSDHSPVQM